MVVEIRIKNPDLSDLQKTQLSSAVSSGATINVNSVTGFGVNDYLVVGDLKSDVAEIVKISTITGLEITVTPSISMSHIQGDRVTKTNYNQVQIHKSATKTGTYALLTTISIDFSNQNNETVYLDYSGSSTDYYKTKYYNSTTTFASSFSDAQRGGGLESYVTIPAFRQTTGITADDISDSVLSMYLNSGARKIRDACYVLRRRELMNRTLDSNGANRYYFDNLYVADDNLDGEITKHDLFIIERNADGTIENDITEQVKEINEYDGYFTLNDGYPTNNSYEIYCTYMWTRYPIAEILEDLRTLNTAYTIGSIIKRQATDSYKRGISSISVPGLSVSRDNQSFKDLKEYYDADKERILRKIKPLRLLPIKGNSERTQFPNSVSQVGKRDRLVGNSNNIFNRMNSYRR